MCWKIKCNKDVLKLTTINLICLQSLFCIYSIVLLAISLTRFQLVDNNGYLNKYFLNSSRNDCIVILSFIGVLVALVGFYKKRYEYLLVYLAVNVASIILLLIGNILAVWLEEVFLDVNDLICITIITVSYALIAAVTVKFYQSARLRTSKNKGAINTDFFISECNAAEFEELENVPLDFVNDVPPKSTKIDKLYSSDYAWLNTGNYTTTYDSVTESNQYLKKVLKQGPHQ